MSLRTVPERPRKGSSARGRTNRRAGVSSEELLRLRKDLREAQETLDAIRNGKVDAVVVQGPNGSQIYSLTGVEQPYRVFVERMQEGAVTVSDEGLILYSNRRFAEMLGQGLERVIGAQVPAIVGESAWREISSVFRMQTGVVKIETRLELPSGAHLPVHLTASRLPFQGQEVLCLVVTDLSAQKQNEELRLAKEVAEKANLAKDTFLAALSHELRTPLNPVLMLASEAATRPELSPQVRADFATICSSIELEARLIDDLLDLTRITHGKLALDSRTLDGHEILNNAIATVRSDLDGKRISVVLDREPGTWLVKADAVRLQQVFWNVLKNSVKFTPEKGQIRIATRGVPRTQKWIVTISDNGRGMTEEELEHAFEAFAQGDHATRQAGHQFGGLGLGLSISKMIAKMHLGDISASSEGRGKGATFVIELPLAAETQGEPETPESPSIESPQGNGLPPDQRINILLVEDHEPTRQALTRLLLRRDYAVSAAATAGEARILAKGNKFHLVISDIGLPDDSGFELMKDLKGRYNLRGIALTGYGTEKDVDCSQKSGFLNHLTKPIRMESLEAALSSAMGEIVCTDETRRLPSGP